jgi:hypothetical protein
MDNQNANKDWDELAKRYALARQKAKDSERSIKFCLFPDKSQCQGKLVRAHAIQNNKILSKLAEKGMLISLDGDDLPGLQNAHPIGRGAATTFSGFCRHHDKVLFQEIEDKPFVCSEKQVFLLTYRTFAWAFMKKLQQAKRNATQDAMLLPDQSDFTKQNYLGCLDNMKQKAFFDRCLLENDDHSMSFALWTLGYEISFATSCMLELDYGIDGELIDPENPKNFEHSIYLNIFPDEKKSYCLWSWKKEDDPYYRKFGDDFLALETKDKENYLNNQLPLLTDAILISPRLWNFWTTEIQKSLIELANFTAEYFEALQEGSSQKYEYEETPWNLFEPNVI